MSRTDLQIRKGSDWQYSAHVGIEGISYDIFIKELADQFSASWVCQKCCGNSTWRAKAPTRQKAIQQARMGAQVHHSLAHSRNSVACATFQFNL
jgi:hypothetical protein